MESRASPPGRDDADARWDGRDARRSINADKNSAPRLPVPASDNAATPQTPRRDQTSSHAQRSPDSARRATSIPPMPLKYSRPRPASGRADPEKRNQQDSSPPPIAARLSRPQPS